MSRIHLDSKFFTSETYCAKYNYLSKWECNDKEVIENGILKNPKTSYYSITSLSYYFQNKTDLVYFPSLNTANCSNFTYTFYNCTHLKEVGELNLSNATTTNGIFFNCPALTKVPKLNTTNKLTDITNMFYNCSSLKEIPVFNTKNVTNMWGTFERTRISTLPLIDTSKATTMHALARHCTSLISVPELDCSSCTDLNQAFRECSSLKEINCKHIHTSFEIDQTIMTREAIVDLLTNGLDEVTTTTTLTMGSAKLALLTDEDKKIATDKGWTLA